MTIAAPDRTLEQRLAALAKGNAVRVARAQLKRDLKAGRKDPRTILLNPPSYAETMKVYDLIRACPKRGRVMTNKILQRARVSPSKTIAGLSDRQRAELVSMLLRKR